MILSPTSAINPESSEGLCVKALADAFKFSLQIFSRHFVNRQDCSGVHIVFFFVDSDKGCQIKQHKPNKQDLVHYRNGEIDFH